MGFFFFLIYCNPALNVDILLLSYWFLNSLNPLIGVNNKNSISAAIGVNNKNSVSAAQSLKQEIAVMWKLACCQRVFTSSGVS